MLDKFNPQILMDFLNGVVKQGKDMKNKPFLADRT